MVEEQCNQQNYTATPQAVDPAYGNSTTYAEPGIAGSLAAGGVIALLARTKIGMLLLIGLAIYGLSHIGDSNYNPPKYVECENPMFENSRCVDATSLYANRHME